MLILECKHCYTLITQKATGFDATMLLVISFSVPHSICFTHFSQFGNGRRAVKLHKQFVGAAKKKKTRVHPLLLVQQCTHGLCSAYAKRVRPSGEATLTAVALVTVVAAVVFQVTLVGQRDTGPRFVAPELSLRIAHCRGCWAWRKKRGETSQVINK